MRHRATPTRTTRVEPPHAGIAPPVRRRLGRLCAVGLGLGLAAVTGASPVAAVAADVRGEPATQANAGKNDDAGFAPGWREQGRISYYGRAFESKTTASGEPFDPEAPTMAHRSLPFGSMVRVTNLRNGRTVVVRVNDRGPFAKGRIADVSRAAARKLGMLRHGVVRGRIELLRLGDEARGDGAGK